MNARRAVVAAVAAWLVVVVVGSTLAWAVISRAGEEVSGDAAEVPSTSESATDPSPTKRSSPRPTKSATSAPTSAPPTSSAPVTTSAAPAPSRIQRTWQGLGGVVVVECRGPAASLVGAQADTGFKVEVEKRGPQRVEVEFDGQGERDQQESKVRAHCANGVPVFEVDSDSN